MERKEDLVLRFCEIVGCDPEEASMYLDMSEGNLDTAVSLFFDNAAPYAENVDDIENLSNDVEEVSDSDVEESGDLRRIYNSQGNPCFMYSI